jgi:cytochrome c-type biogenesis protein CcmE
MSELAANLDTPVHPNRLKFLIGGGVIAIAIIYLVFTATQSTAAYFFTVEELYAKGAAIYDRNLRVSGKVTSDTIDFNSRDLVLRFQVVGESGQRLSVVFNGPKPDQLRPDAEAILEGRFDGHEFSAQTLLLKCPSRYEEKGATEEKVEAVR